MRVVEMGSGLGGRAVDMLDWGTRAPVFHNGETAIVSFWKHPNNAKREMRKLNRYARHPVETAGASTEGLSIRERASAICYAPARGFTADQYALQG
jgi:hypothetical protein